MQDIHTKNKQFEYRDEPSEEYLKTKLAIDNGKQSKVEQK